MGQAVCRLASQESTRIPHEETGSVRRAGCASSRLATPRGELEPGDEDKTPQRLSGQKQDDPDKSDRGAGQERRAPRPRPTNEETKTLPRGGSEAKERGYALQMPVQGKGTI
jgi:hypothetical protein